MRYLLEAAVLTGVIWDQALTAPYPASTRNEEESTGLKKKSCIQQGHCILSAEISVVNNPLKNQLRMPRRMCICNCFFGIQPPLRQLGYLVCAEKHPEHSVCFQIALLLES